MESDCLMRERESSLTLQICHKRRDVVGDRTGWSGLDGGEWWWWERNLILRRRRVKIGQTVINRGRLGTKTHWSGGGKTSTATTTEKKELRQSADRTDVVDIIKRLLCRSVKGRANFLLIVLPFASCVYDPRGRQSRGSVLRCPKLNQRTTLQQSATSSQVW